MNGQELNSGFFRLSVRTGTSAVVSFLVSFSCIVSFMMMMMLLFAKAICMNGMDDVV